MYRWLLIVSLLSACIFAKEIRFKETKFIDALEMEISREGILQYNKDNIIIHYSDGKTVVKNDQNLTVYNKKNEVLTVMDLNKKPSIAIYFQLTKILFLNKFQQLNTYFKVSELSKNRYRLMTKGEAERVISSIELVLNPDQTIHYFIINFTNMDTVKIEEI